MPPRNKVSHRAAELNLGVLRKHPPRDRQRMQIEDDRVAARHVVTEEGRVPDPGAPWGWRHRPGGGDEPLGSKVGWLEGEDLYLDQEAAYRAAQSVVGNAGESLGVSARTLARRLRERGLLRSVDSAGKRMTVRRSLEGTRRHVLHLASATIHEPVDSELTEPEEQNL